jgi:hypothetical protein
MSHFIILTRAIKRKAEDNVPTHHYRIRADRIDWIAQCYPTDTETFYTKIGVNGIELHVEEPAHVILDYIKDPHAPLLGEEQYERNPNILDYQKKYGDEEGWKRFKEVMHLN